ncbi:MAG: DUF4268 domain-containing protein [Candidatus Kapaibacteriota bacterium]
MLYIFEKKKKNFLACDETDFRKQGIMERKDIEKWVIDFPYVLGEELLIITSEYDKFDKTKERLDLLAIDKNGKLVIVELKRDESGKNVELQAIKYAAYCSTMTMADVVSLRKEFIAKNGKELSEEEVKKELFDFVDNPDFEELDEKPRIILVAREFKPEVTASVLWLRKFGLEISCVKLTPYDIDDEKIGLVTSTIIPLPEAEEYLIKSERKESKEGTLTRSQEEYREFYKDLRMKIKDVIPNLPEPLPRSYYLIPTGIGKVHFEWGFHGRPRNSFGVELHFEKGDKAANRRLLKELEKFKDEIEEATGEKVIFQEDWGQRWSRLYIEKAEGRMTNELKEWAVEKMKILYKLLQPKLEKLKGHKFDYF